MKSFKIADGDLVVSARRVEMVTNEDKLVQDLSLWLRKPIGSDFTAPNFGSTLLSLIGAADAREQRFDAESEVLRVLALYQATQFEKVKSAIDNGTASVYSRRELLNEIRGVNSSVDQDTVTIVATIATAQGRDISLPVIVSEGI